MQHGKIRQHHSSWSNLRALPHVERLEAACHRVILPAGGEEERTALRTLLSKGVGEGLNPLSPAASLSTVAAKQISELAALLDEETPNVLVLRVTAARLCQTLTTMRGHLSGGRRLVGVAPRLIPVPDSH